MFPPNMAVLFFEGGFILKYNVVVIGAGHAGCEAALAASRRGFSTLLVTMTLDSIAQMSCNPAVGGLAKGQIVRELDALGGEMAKITDAAGLQFRMLNRSRGPAVWSPRAQCDKKIYQHAMKSVIENSKNLDLIQSEVTKILSAGGRVAAVELKTGDKVAADAVIITAGTFLRGIIHVGMTHFAGGRYGEFPSDDLSASIQSHGIEIKRLKTGTPPRINGTTIAFEKCSAQDGDNPPEPFSHFTNKKQWQDNKQQIPCWLTYTNEDTHAIIRNNLDRSPLYQGVIKGIGPRYCPSIEDKVVRFQERARHQVFLEPEGYGTREFYANGISTSLPQDVQEKIVHSIAGLENAKIMRYGYAIEYDFFPPQQLKPSLESKALENLFFAGQVNGTTGYEEAAGQGLIAGINATLKIQNEPPLILKRNEAYLGVLIDDLVTKGVDEPYRMFTSRAEYRLMLRSDNADTRMIGRGHSLGLISDEMYHNFEKYLSVVNDTTESSLTTDDEMLPWTRELAQNEAAIEKKYDGYIARQKLEVTHLQKMEDKKIPPEFDYNAIPGFLTETRQKLLKVRPLTLGQASRISGVTPADIAILYIHLTKGKK